jgi:hypothetical protein
MFRFSAPDNAALYLMLIELHRRQIRLQPPQRVALIEVTRIVDGVSFKVIHVSGHESDDASQPIPGPATPEMVQWVAELQSEQLEAKDVQAEQFPIVEALDLTELPVEYRLVPEELSKNFEFTPGEDFQVFVIGDEIVETIVTAS